MELIDSVLTEKEREVLLQRLGRQPTVAEGAMVAAMWSEHCSYKHSRYFLSRLPRQAPHLLAGPGENAGVIEITPSLAVAFKIESHNHPSAVVPYQGAATGVGGILRDVFTMGARPLALMNSLHFHLSGKRGKVLFDRVVQGIGDYGNCTGIPTVGGEVESFGWFQENPLMNALCLGKISPQKVLKSSTARPGDLVLYFGNKTGRDGLEGAIFASLALSEERKEQKSAVQVGDPFMGRLIMEASLEFVEKGIPSAMQDMGAAGLTCSTGEIAFNSGVGITLDLDRVPLRATHMKGEEILLSESQERMLAAIPPEKKAEAEALLDQYPLDYAWIGELDSTDRMEVTYKGKEIASMEVALLIDGCPLEEYPQWTEEALREDPRPLGEISPPPLHEIFVLLKETPALATKEYIYQQFDYEIGLKTLAGPNSPYTLLYDEEEEAAISLEIQSRSGWMQASAYLGARATLAQAFRSSIAQGAYPLGMSNCLNFPSPEREPVVKALGQTVLAMTEFCRQMDIPVTGGNVSLYNETEDSAIPPTPVFVLVGKSLFGPHLPPLMDRPGQLFLTGHPRLSQSEVYLHYLHQKGRESEIQVPAVDFDREKALARRLLALYEKHSPSELAIRSLGRGGLWAQMISAFHYHSQNRKARDRHLWDFDFGHLVNQESKFDNYPDLLWGEGAETYLLFLPQESKVEEEELLGELADYQIEKIGRICLGKGFLRDLSGQGEKADLWQWSQENSLEDFLFSSP